MIRKLLLPAMCAALLGGCVTAGYGYSDGYNDGGYYYGRPAARYYGGASYGYGYPYSRYYGGAYGYPYGYGYGGYPYYYYPRGHYHGDGHNHGHGDHDDDDDHHGGNDNDNDNGDGDNNGGKPPWRRWADDGGDMLRRRQETQPGAVGRLATPSPRQGVIQRPTPRIAAPPRNVTPRVDAPSRNVERRAVPQRPARAPAPRARSERELRRAQEP
ncbi:hypothetical protein [Lysobacter sp. M15]|uniref:hypothetical protein n=1 Tax=Lysobacter sp. M15 TaxID=2916837 RepID=UPI001F590B37|nr:hypothetical protein [Lysobacter sp. M15]